MAQTAAKFSEGPDSLSHTQPEENNKRRSVAYLGRGLDATKPPESWCSKLDGYDVEPVIDTTEIKDGKFVEAHGVAQSRPFYAKDVNSARKKVQVERCNSFKSQSASDIVVDFAEHPTASALIRGESKRGLWLCKKQSASETVSLRRDDTDCEPSDETDVTTYTDYSKFERELYEHIANEMNLAVESDTDSIEAVKELDGAIGRNEISEGEEQELAKACYSFIEGKQVTHYVHSITLGTAFGGLSNFRFSWIKPKALLIRKLEEMTESELAIGDHTNFHPQRPQKQFLSKSFCGMMGELTSEGGEAIIECSIKPISTLVTMKSLGDFFRKELSLYAKNQIFDPIGGPFVIAHPDHTMFLKVNDVSGVTSTSERSNASLFYVEQIKSNHLHLTYYETSYNAKHRKKPLYVTMKRSTIIGRSRREHGQLTVESEIDQKDSCFKLKHQIQGSKTPATALERWMNGEPFFIKTAYGHPFKREQFLTITSTGATGMNSRTTPLCLLSGT